MKRHRLIIGALLAANLGLALTLGHLIRLRSARAELVAAVGPPPDLSRWSPALGEALNAALNRLDRAATLDDLRQLACLYEANGFTSAALRVWHLVAIRAPRDAPALYHLAQLHLRTGDTTAALTALQATVQLAPDYAPAQLELGNQLTAGGHFTAAGLAYRRALDAAPSDPRARYAWLAHTARHGAGGASPQELAALARAYPDTRQINELLASLDEARGDPAAAIRHRRAATAAETVLPTTDPWLDALTPCVYDSERLRLQAYRLRREQRLPEAATALLRAIDLNPTEPALRKALAEVYEAQNDVARARSVLAAAVTATPDDSGLWVRLTRLQSLAGDHTAALATIDRALTRWPDDAVLHLSRGLTLRDAQDLPAALAAFRRAIDLDPTAVEARYNLGLTLALTGSPTTARTELAAALAQRPDYPEALRALGGLLLGANEPIAALPLCARLHDLQPDNPDALVLLGLAQRGAGQPDRARTTWQQGLDLARQRGDRANQARLENLLRAPASPSP